MGRDMTRRDFMRVASAAATLAAGGGLANLLDACGGAAPAPKKLVEADVSKLYAKAKQDGQVTWWTAHYEQSAAEAMAAAFKAKYPGIEVNLTRQTAQVINTRLQQEIRTGQFTCDVFASTDEAHYPPLKKQNLLASYKPPDIDLIPKQFQNLDADNTYHLGALGFVLINYRSDQVSSPPKSWKDLLNPQWSGKITTGHPGFSGYVGNWVLAMNDKYGDSYLRDLAKNKPKINRSVNDTVTDIINGERQVGAGPDNYSLAQKAKGTPINIQFPTDDAILIAAPVGVISKGPHQNAAQLFVNFMYSKEYSEALVKTSNYPLRSDITPPSGEQTIDKIKWYRNKVDRLSSGVPQMVDLWRDIMGV